jgi:hypothetical protein
MRKLLFVLAAGSVIVIATALPAAAAASSQSQRAATAGADPPTSTSFTVTNGALTMSVPTSVDLGSGTPGTTIGPTAFGPVTVTDNRASLTASWTATVSSTDFLTGAGTAAETIPATDATYTTGTVSKTGTITVTSTGAVTLAGIPQTVVAGTAGVGDNSATWNPTIAVAVPSAAVAGLYTATVMHSVS